MSDHTNHLRPVSKVRTAAKPASDPRSYLTISTRGLDELRCELGQVESGFLGIWDGMKENNEVQASQVLGGYLSLLELCNDKLGLLLMRLDPHGKDSVFEEESNA